MKATRTSLVMALSLCCASPASWAQATAPAKAASAVTAAPLPALSAADASRRAAEACEQSVADTVRVIRDKKEMELQFIGAQRSLSTTQSDETGVKGEGRYRAPGGRLTPFTYTCTFNAKTGATSGVMFKEKGVAPTAAVAPAWQPDLNKVSPEACETAVAATLKRKYPRVDRIALDAASRQLVQGPEGRSQLRGTGAVVRAPGMHAIPLSYRCDFDGRSGALIDTQIQD
jgi:hypothetical protein